MKKTLLRNYAKLIARVGGNIRPGQRVEITAQLDQPGFIAMLTEECYRAGASRVTVHWQSQALEKLASRFESVKELAGVPAWEEAQVRERAEELPVTIKILSADPDGMRGADREKLTLAQMARSAIIKPYTDAMLKPPPVVRGGRPFRRMGEKDLSRGQVEYRRRAALGPDPARFARGRQGPAHRLDVAQPLAARQVRQAQRARAERAGIPQRQRHPPACGADRGGAVHFREEVYGRRPLFQPQHPDGGVLHDARPRQGGGDRVRGQAALVRRRADRGLLAAVRRGARGRLRCQKERGDARKDPRDGRGRFLSRRVRARPVRFARQRNGHPVLQHAVRRKRLLSSRARPRLQQYDRRV